MKIFQYNQPRSLPVAILVFILFQFVVVTGVFAGGMSFVEPAWIVGEPDTTFQEWQASIMDPFLAEDTLPSSSEDNPALGEEATMGVELPGFPASSGGYYSFGGDYSVYADVFNQGGSAGVGGPYPDGYGTRVFVQTAATMNGSDSVYTNLLEIVAPDGSPIAGGCHDCKLGVSELFVGDVETPIGIASQQELLFEFWLPEYIDDFRVEFDVIVHSSFQHLRIDSQVEAPASMDPDLNADGQVDGSDFLHWQRSAAAYGDEGLLVWQQSYATSPSALHAIPEPTSAILLLSIVVLFRPRSQRC